MLDWIPLVHYFKCKNQYSGSEAGMRYLITPGKQKQTAADGSEKEVATLTVDIWPDPWALEKTDPALRRREVFPLDEEGRTQVIALLREAYEAEEERWNSCPSILDCEPWKPAPEPEPEPENAG
jgi:hypothetical protein